MGDLIVRLGLSGVSYEAAVVACEVYLSAIYYLCVGIDAVFGAFHLMPLTDALLHPFLGGCDAKESFTLMGGIVIDYILGHIIGSFDKGAM